MKKKNIIISSKFIGLLIFLFLTSFLTIRSFKEVKLDDLFIEGDEFITKKDLIDNSSLIFPTKLIFIKTSYIEKELKENLSLKNISINRRLIPFQLKIYLQTRIPIAYAESNKLNRKIGTFTNAFIDPDGNILDSKLWDKNFNNYLPSNEDNLFIESLMVPEHEPGKYASWIAAPDQGIDNKSGDFEYVKFHDA